MAGESPRISVDLKMALNGEAIASLSDDVRQLFLQRMLYMARAKWVKLAQERLNTTKRSYIASLSGGTIGPGVASLTLSGAMANAIENGWSAYDMHDTLLGANVPVVPRGSGLKGKYRKKDGSGYYRPIPFRHATPGTQGAVGPAMGSAYKGMMGSYHARAAGKEIYKAAQRLRATREIAYSVNNRQAVKFEWGGRLKAGMAPKLKPHHKSDIYAGMVKFSKTYAKATQSKYGTFRMISTGSPGWRVGAKVGKMLVKDVEAFCLGQGEKTWAYCLRAFTKKQSTPTGEPPPTSPT